MARQKRAAKKRVRVGWGSGPYGFGAVEDRGVVFARGDYPTVDAMMVEWARWAAWSDGGLVPAQSDGGLAVRPPEGGSSL